MKTLVTLLALGFLTNGTKAQDPDGFSAFSNRGIEMKPSTVTVFLTGAELGHTNEVKLTKGKNELKFTNLSSKMDQNSIVVDVDNKNVTILSVFFNNNFLSEMQKNPQVKVLNDSIENIQDRLFLLESKKETIAKEKELLFKKDYTGLDNDVKKLAEYTDFCRKRRDDLNVESYKFTKHETKLKDRLALFKNQLDEVNLYGGIPGAEINVIVLANESTTAKVDLKYRVVDAGWAPKYDIRVDGVTKPVNLYYKANVYNNTGVNWDNVKLKLSTADPLQGAQYPKMQDWNLKQDQSQTVSYQNAQKQLGELRRQNTTMQFKTLEVDELSAEFEIALPYTIPSDNRAYLVDVNNKQLDAKYQYISVPKMDKDAFLVAKVVGWADLNLVSGSASIYYNGSYIGQSQLNIQEISDTLELSLGRDNKIAITRIKKSETNDHQFIGNYEKEVFNYEIVVRNNRELPISINILDQVPLENDSRMEVNISEISKGTYNKYNGQVNWAMALQPGETRKITFNFSAKYPKDLKPRKKAFRTISAPSF